MRIANRTSLNVIPGERGAFDRDRGGTAFDVFKVNVKVVNVKRTPIG